MEKFAIDLDSVLDELEKNDDDNDRAPPPSLVKIITCNVYTSGANCGLSYSWSDINRTDNVVSSLPSSSISSSSSSSRSYKRMSIPSYIDSHNIEKIDVSEADFGISVKPLQIESFDVTVSEIENHHQTDKCSNNAIESQIECNFVDDMNIMVKRFDDNAIVNENVTSIVNDFKLNSDDNDEDVDEDESDTFSTTDDTSDDVLCVEIENNGAMRNGDINDAADAQIEIKLLSHTHELSNNKSVDSKISPEIIHNNDVSDETEVSDESDSLMENDKTLPDAYELSDKIDRNDEINEFNDTADNNKNDIIISNCESTLGTNEEISNLMSDKSVESINKEETNDFIEVNDNAESSVMKFMDIDVSVDDITEDEIERYLSDMNDNFEDIRETNLLDISNANLSQNLEIPYDYVPYNRSLFDNLTESNNCDNSQSNVASAQTIDTDQTLDITCASNTVTDSNTQTLTDSQCNDIPIKLQRPNSLLLQIIPEHASVSDQQNGNDNANISDDVYASDAENIESPDLPSPASASNENHIDNNSMINHYDLMNGLSEDEQMLGKVKPFWIPDNDTQNCMHCDAKFTVIRRRHHCRACGKVLCAQCCNQKAKLVYLDNKDARVCQICFSTLIRVGEIEQLESLHSSPARLSTDSQPEASSQIPGDVNADNENTFRSPDPNNPAEYCSMVPPLEQAQSSMNRPPPTVMVPVGVLKRADRPRGEPKQVKFSDGIRPGGDLTDNPEEAPSLPLHRRLGRLQFKLKSPSVEAVPSPGVHSKSRNSRLIIGDVNGPLPPIINASDLICNAKSVNTVNSLIELLKETDISPLIFAVTKNLHVITKIVKKDCCVQSECWSFTTKGMSTIGQDELLILIERLPDEDTFPRDIFRLFTTVYDSAFKGTTFNDMSHIYFPDGLFGNRDNSGFLFIRPSLQCFTKLTIPSPPFLIGILIHKWEIPWAKIFPLRLVLRLGAEYRYYPCPIVSYRFRKPAYCEIGHTIMNVLADFRNYQYTLPVVPGLVIHLQDKRITVLLPRNRYDKVLKVLNNSNEHVLPFGANFSIKADSHLVCIQNDDGQYQTQAINIENAPRSITGASFIVFSGALKSSTGLTAKMSIVEDGLLVQIPPNVMSELKNNLKDMKNYVINCGKISAPMPDEVITLSWSEDDNNINIGVRSPIDGTSLEGIHSVRIYNGTDYANDKFLIRWTEVFFIHFNENGRRADTLDPSRLAESAAQSMCLALTPHLEALQDNGYTKIGLRVNVDPDKVGYEVGSKGVTLPPPYTNELDSALIPVIMDNIATGVEDMIVMEMIFHILVK